MILGFGNSVGLEKPDTKSKTDDQQESINDQESLKVDESCKKGVTEDKADEEDVCPICLEGCVSLDHCRVYLFRLIGYFFPQTCRRAVYLILKRAEGICPIMTLTNNHSNSTGRSEGL